MKEQKTIITYFKLNEKERAFRLPFSSAAEVLNSKRVAVGRSHFVSLDDNGKVIVYGDNRYGQRMVKGWETEGIVKVAAGDCHTVGLKQDGTLKAVGDNRCGQCDVGEWTDVVDIYAKGSKTVGIRKDGTLLATGGDPLPDAGNNHDQQKNDAEKRQALNDLVESLGQATAKKSSQPDRLSKDEAIKKINGFKDFYIKFALKQMGRSGFLYVHRLDLLDEDFLNELYRNLVKNYSPEQ